MNKVNLIYTDREVDILGKNFQIYLEVSMMNLKKDVVTLDV